MLAEFELIDHFFKPLGRIGAQAKVPIGDDGAVWSDAMTYADRVVATDTLIESVHFPESTRPEAIAWKALAVNLSDLAAMGATPTFYSLALTLPQKHHNQAWLSRFALGLARLAKQFQIPLVGGDTTRGPVLAVTITAQGWVRSGQAWLRSGAQVNDLIGVTGTVGDGGLGLHAVQVQADTPWQRARLKLNRPMPRVTFAQAATGCMHSAIDCSDGFLADMTHLLKASNKGAVLDYSTFPFSKEMHQALNQNQFSPFFPLNAGDDYELILTFPSEAKAQVLAAGKASKTPVQIVGQVTSNETLRLYDSKQRFAPKNIWSSAPASDNPEFLGYRHF